MRLLALTHLSARYRSSQLHDEARGVFERAVVPGGFDTVDVPLPERGEPDLPRWDAELRAPAPRLSAGHPT